jgi:hypothetical protein
MTRTFFYYLLAVLILRLFLSLTILRHDPLVPWETDSRGYYHLAYSLLHNGSFQMDGKPETFRTPGYPVFLAGVFKIWGDSLPVVVFIQVFLSCLGIFFVYKLAQCLWNDETRALMMAVIYSLDPWTFQISLSIGSDTLFTVMVLGFALLALRLFSDPPPTARWYVFSAIVLAACVFTRPLIYYFIIPFGLFLVFDKRRWRGLVLVVVIYALLVSAWTVRNYYKTNSAIFTSATEHLYWNYEGKILAMVNHTSSEEEDTKESQMAIQKEKISQKAMVEFCDQEAMKIISNHPFLFIKAFFDGMYSSVWSPGTLFFRERIGGHNNILREAIKWFGISYLFAGYMLALWGVVQLTLKKRWSSQNLFLFGLLLYLIIFSATPVGYYRFRLPFWPFICLFAGYSIPWPFYKKPDHD